MEEEEKMVMMTSVSQAGSCASPRCAAPCFALLVSHTAVAVAVAVQLQTTAIGRSTVSADE